MTHSKCGLLLLLAAAAVAACGGDPTGSFQQTDEEIVATPTSLFLDQGSSVFVVAELHDAQGNQLVADFTPTNVGANISVVLDTAFLETTNGTKLPTRERFIITGLAAGATSFTLTKGNTTLDIPVKVTPIELPAVFSSATPASDEIVNLSAPSYIFLPGTTVVVGADSAIVLDIAPDGSSVNFLPVPGSTGPVTVSGAAINFLPTVPLTLPAGEMTVGALAALPGTDAPGTAPVLATPASGNKSALFDTGSFGSVVCGVANDGAPCQLYKFNVPADGSYDAELLWNNSTDLGLYVLTSDGTGDTGQACDDFGNQTDPNNPGGIEACTITLTAGDYIMALVNFGPFYPTNDPAPSEVTLKVVAP